MLLAEVGVHTTVNIAPETNVSFSGTFETDPVKIVEDGPMLSSCDFFEYPYVCFTALSEGYLTVELGTSTFIESVRMMYDKDWDY